MSERLAMEGKLLQLEREANNIRLRWDGMCDLVCQLLNTALYPKPEEMEIVKAAKHMDDLVMAQAELLSILSEIKKLEKKLGR
jgi:hypothetical protein